MSPVSSGYISQNVLSPFISIELGTMSLTWRGDENRPDFFMSLTHKRVLESSNTATIKITYYPHIGESIDKIDDAILDSAGICLFQYGNQHGSYSEVYRGYINNYSIQFHEGYLSYTFDLVSSVVRYNLVKAYQAFQNGNNPLPGRTGYYAYFDDKPTFINGLNRIAALLHEDYIFEDPTDVLSGAVIENIEVKTDCSPILCMINALSKVTNEKDDESNSTLYTVEISDVVSDSNGRGTIRVVKVTKKSTPPISYTFEWGTPNGTVLSWDVDYKGSAALAKVRNHWDPSKGGSGLNKTAYRMISFVTPDADSVKEAVATTVNKVMGSTDSQNYLSPYLFSSNLIYSRKEFMKYADYTYTATLTTLGVGGLIALGETRISVTPMIRNQSHFTAGTYIVNGVTDSVDREGFTTTFKLLREPEGSTTEDSIDHLQNYFYYNGNFIPYSTYNPYE